MAINEKFIHDIIEIVDFKINNTAFYVDFLIKIQNRKEPNPLLIKKIKNNHIFH